MTIRFLLTRIIDQARECHEHRSESFKNHKKYPKSATAAVGACTRGGAGGRGVVIQGLLVSWVDGIILP